MDQFNRRKIAPIKFCSIPLSKIHPFYHGNVTTCKILFPNDDKLIKLVYETENKKSTNIKLIFIVLNAQSL